MRTVFILSGEMMNKELKKRIQEDVYRNANGRSFISRLLAPNPNLKFLKAFRCAQHYRKKSILYYFYRFKLSYFMRRYFIQIPIETKIGRGLYIGHFGRIIVNRRAVIGNNVNIATGITIGQTNREKRQGCPTIGNKVWIGTNAVIVGGIKIGDDVMIAPNSFVNFDVPNGSIVIGNPGQIISRENATEGYINNMV